MTVSGSGGGVGQLNVDTDAAFNIAHALSNDAEELRQELSALIQQWRNLSQGWSGAAASAYTPLWEDWHQGATQIVDALAESSRDLAQAAVAYAEQDTNSAEALEAPALEMGL
ncbi:WXG100 family type VII secretion target [Mycobacterium sp. LTG2003]